MLQAIRDKAQGWIAWAIVILISIPFALWGIQEYLGVGGEPEVAVVDGQPITQRMLDQRVRDFRENLRLTFGEAYRADLFEDLTLQRQVRDAMVDEIVLAGSVGDWNMRTSDAQARGFIASIPAFQRDGRFDQQAYELTIRNRGMSASGFEESVRQDMAVEQLRSGIQDTAFVTDSALATRVRLAGQTRDLRFARVAADRFRDAVQPDAAAVRAFYDANTERYRTPERLKLSYLLLDAATLTRFVEVDEAALREYFDAHRAEFIAPEQRAMRHILVAVGGGADEAALAAAQTRAEELLEQLRAGADFAELARTASDDPGSAAAGGDLGWVEPGVMVAPFEEAAFRLPVGELSDLVRTDFGFHIIQVTDLRGGSEADFAQVRDQVEAALRKFEAENLYFDYAERLAETAYESPDSLTPAAESLGLEVGTTDWITRDGLPAAPLDSPRVVDAAFADDVLVERNNSELIELGPTRAVVVRIGDYESAGVQSFDAHRAEIEADYVVTQATRAAAEAGRAAIETLQSGGGGLTALAEGNGWPVEQHDGISRDAARVPAAVREAAFTLQPPADGATAYTGVTTADGDFLVIAVSNARPGQLDAVADAERAALEDAVRRQHAAKHLRYLTASLRQRTDVELKPLEGETE